MYFLVDFENVHNGGITNITYDKIFKIANALEVSPEYFININENIMDDRYTYLLRETARCIKALNSNEKIEVVYQSLPASLLPQRTKIIDLLVNFCTRGSDLKKYADIKAQEEFEKSLEAKKSANIIEFKRK